MRKNMLGSLAGLLVPLAAFATPVGYAYQRTPQVGSAALQPLAQREIPPMAMSPLADATSLAITGGAPIQELVIVDAAAPDKHVFHRTARPGIAVVELDAHRPGLEQLAEVLAQYRNLAALHVVSHASDGVLLLGNSRIDSSTIAHNTELFAALNGALRNGGDLLFYGCDLAAGTAGHDLLDIVRSNTHLDIAASNDMTGSATLQGDWDLEIRKGDIETSQPFSEKALQDFSAVLAAPDGKYDPGTFTEDGLILVSPDFIVGARDATDTSKQLDLTIVEGVAYILEAQSTAAYFYVNANGTTTDTFVLTGVTAGEYDAAVLTNLKIIGVLPDNSTIESQTIAGTPAGEETFIFGPTQLANFSGVQLKGFKLYAEGTKLRDIEFFDFRDFTIANAQNPPASNATLTPAAGVTEPVNLSTTVNTSGSAVDVLDFTIGDPGIDDNNPVNVTQIVVNKTGSASDALMNKVVWRLSGPDASNVVGTYDSANDTLTFSGLSISVASGQSETYRINAYFSDNSSVTDGATAVLTIASGDITVGTGSTKFAPDQTVSNDTGTRFDVIATKLAFTTQPLGSVSGSALTIQPVVAAQDAFGNTDLDFTETLTLTTTGTGSLSGGTTKAATAGVATFSGVIYSATADHEAFKLQVNDQDGVGSDLDTVDSQQLSSDVVATKLVFTTQPSPLATQSGVEVDFTTDPVVSALNNDDILDTDFENKVMIGATGGAGDAQFTIPGDQDASPETVTVTAVDGVAAFTGLKATYTNKNPSDNETWNLFAQATDLAVAYSDQLSSVGLPSLSSATYDASTGTLVVTGLNFEANGSGADVDVSKLTITGEDDIPYRLTDSADVEIDSETSFTVTLSATDKAAVNQILNRNGETSTGGTAYNLAADDDFITAVTDGDTADATNKITVSNVAPPGITSVAYDYGANTLTLTGTGFLKRAGAGNDIDVSRLTITGEGGGTYKLQTSSDVDITDGTTATIVLSGADIPNVEALLNKDGSTSAISGTAFALAADDDWNTGADATEDIAVPSSPVTVSAFANPTITSATYNASTGTFVVTGDNFIVNPGAANDVVASLLTLRGGANETYTLTDTASVEITSATEFTLTLSPTDRRHVNGVLNRNGTASGSATTYNLEAADDWMAGSPAANDIADASANAIDVSGTQTPTITSATYDATTGIVVVTGTNFVHKPGAANDVDLSKLTFTGGVLNATYTLKTANDVEITSDTSFTFTLEGADKAGVEQLLDQLGKVSAGGSTYNLAGADDWLTGADALANIADAGPNEVTVSIPPSITSATYNAATGTLVVTGKNFEQNGDGLDIDASKLTLTGEGGETRTLTDSAGVERDSLTQFTIVLSAADRAAVNLIMNRNGTQSTDDTVYNLSAADDFVTAVTEGDTADTTNAVTVSNVAAPQITSATYDATLGQLVVTGTNFLSRSGGANDIVASLFTITGEGGATHTLSSTANVDITNGTTFTLTLSAADRMAVNQLLNKAGTASTGGTTYNLAAAEDWAAGAAAAVTVADTTGNAITVSNIPTPAITSATYDAATGVLVVTGTDFVAAAGANNDIDVSKLTLTGETGGYTLTTGNVEIDSPTQFTVTLNATDRAMVNMDFNKDGTSSTGGTFYNIAAAEDWITGADAAVVVADLTDNAITVSNVAVPTITSAAYDYAANTLTLTGTGFLKRNGILDIQASALTLLGEGNASYQLSTSDDVDITSGTTAVITLSGLDVPNVEALLNQDGTQSATSMTIFNVAAAGNWNRGADTALNIADPTTPVTVSNFANPAVLSAEYDAATGTLVVTGTDFVANNGGSDVDVSLLTLRGGADETVTLVDSVDVEVTSATEFTVTLSAADRRHVNGVLNRNGLQSGSGTVYNLEAADDWMTASPQANDISDTDANGIDVANTAVPVITSATYDAGTGIVVVTGQSLVHKPGADNDVDLSKLTFRGGNNATYTLTTATGVEITSDTSFTFTLEGADQSAVAALLDKLGTSSSAGTPYNLLAADDWLRGADPIADIGDAGPNTVTVTVPPAITSATYDAAAGTLVVTGTNFQANGSGPDVDASLLTITGEGGETWTLTDTADVDIDGITQFTLTLSAADRAALALILNKDGTTSTGDTTYNLAAADDYLTGVTAGDTADTTNALTVSNVPAPTITSATYDASTGELVVTGTGFAKAGGAANDIDVSKLSIVGEDGESVVLTSASVEIADGTTFTVMLNAADMNAVNPILNRDGVDSTGGTPYALVADEDWAAGADAALTIIDDSGNGITVSNVAVPEITSATYNVVSGELVVTGTGFVKFAGADNDIDVTKLTVTGNNAGTYTLTSGNVDITSATSFKLTLNSTDKAAVDLLLDRNGGAATSGTPYNLAAAEDWALGADANVDVEDLVSTIAVSGYAPPSSDPGPNPVDPGGDDGGPLVIDSETSNSGTLHNPTITPTGSIDGGTLSGTVQNDGTIRNVDLAPGTIVEGGTVDGTITGDPDSPALINSDITANAQLENVVIGADATIDPDAQLNGNVRFESTDNIPPGLDLTRALSAIPWESYTETLAVNLDDTLLANPGPDDLTLLEQIRALDEYRELEPPLTQDPDTGELVIDSPDFNARVVPTSVTRAEPGTPPGTQVNADGNIEIVTETGLRIVAHPAAADADALRGSFSDAGLETNFNALGNLEVSRPEAEVYYTGRPVATAVPAAPDATPGVRLYPVGVPVNGSGASLVYEDENGMLWEQEIVPVPSNWPALKARLLAVPGASDARITQGGIISVMVNGMPIRGRAAYAVIPGEPTGSDIVELQPAGDQNGDGIGDYVMVFPNGDRQILLILP